MSLINDALKRAKEAQRRRTPTPNDTPQFKPAAETPAGKPRNWVGMIIIAGVCVLGSLTAGLTAVSWLKPKPVPEVRARSTMPKVHQAQPANPPSASTIATLSSSPAAAKIVAAASASPAAPAPAPAEVPPQPVLSVVTNVVTEPVPAVPVVSVVQPTVEVLNPEPKILRLQAIVYNPARPSAMINGKTLFVGETLGDYQLVSVTRQSAQMVVGTRTNVLHLAQ